MLRNLVQRRVPLSAGRALSRPDSRLRSFTTSPSTSSAAATPSTYPELRVSTLANGIRVASDPTPGHFVAAGVYVDAGSRYESSRTTGAGHMVDRLGFKVSPLSTSCACFVRVIVDAEICDFVVRLFPCDSLHGIGLPTR